MYVRMYLSFLCVNDTQQTLLVARERERCTDNYEFFNIIQLNNAKHNSQASTTGNCAFYLRHICAYLANLIWIMSVWLDQAGGMHSIHTVLKHVLQGCSPVRRTVMYFGTCTLAPCIGLDPDPGL